MPSGQCLEQMVTEKQSLTPLLYGDKTHIMWAVLNRQACLHSSNTEHTEQKQPDTC